MPSLKPGGKQQSCTLVCCAGRSASTSGYQPFISSNATGVSFYVKQTASGSSNIGAASGATIPPSVQLSIGNAEEV